MLHGTPHKKSMNVCAAPNCDTKFLTNRYDYSKPLKDRWLCENCRGLREFQKLFEVTSAVQPPAQIAA